MQKRIRLTVEWDGDLSEFDWGMIIADDIEDDDRTGSCVVEIERWDDSVFAGDWQSIYSGPARVSLPKPAPPSVRERLRRLLHSQPVDDPFWLFVVMAGLLLGALWARGTG